MADRQIGRFRVRGELGRGGMGVVYRAEDPALGRAVALKLLPPEAASEFHAREQLLAEARAAAVLDHPNLCTVYDVGESDEGEVYFAMALYEGQTLGDRLEQGRLPLSEATDIAIQIAQGLTAAHAIGIVHRDIKPSNVMLTRGGLVKILDFGIARAVTDPDVNPAAILGTPRYMAPEQLDGTPDVDDRVDAWALGVLFYEMISGSVPFAGGDTRALTEAILRQPPLPIDADLTAFATVKPFIHALLDKDRQRRLTVAEFLKRIRQPAVMTGGASGGPLPRSLAVLPFRPVGGDKDDEFFADGLTAEIIADLSTVRPLRVTSWMSARRYREVTMSPREVARELDVHYILDGSVQRAGSEVRITAHLIDATNDTEIWSGKYGGTLEDVFDIQERVAEAITGELRLELARGSISASARSIADSAAYDLYLRARGEIWSFTDEGPQRAIALIDQALEVIGPNALLLATRATALWQLVNTGATHLSGLIEAGRTARRALELDPASVPALRVLALMTAMRGDSKGARDLIERALAAAPGDPETLSTACVFFSLFGDGERAAALGRRATELDPFYAFHWTALGFALASLGRDDEAVFAVRRAFEVGPRDLPTQVIGPLIVYGRGEIGPAFDQLATSPSPAHATAGGYAGLAHLTRAALGGDHARVSALVTPDVQLFLESGVHNALYAAEIFSLVGDRPRALRYLSRAADLGLRCHDLIATYSRALAPLRQTPGFDAVLAKMK